METTSPKQSSTGAGEAGQTGGGAGGGRPVFPSPDLKVKLLLEEWKQNVALYMDQDKRGFARVGVFLTVQAGLLVLFGVLLKDGLQGWRVPVACSTAVAALFLTVITYLMSKRAHAFIILRVIQARLIEKAIRDIIAPELAEPDCPPKEPKWPISRGVITTFTREHAAFTRKRNQKPTDWLELVGSSVGTLGEDASKVLKLKGTWWWSMGHLFWLCLVFITLFAFWLAIVSVVVVLYAVGDSRQALVRSGPDAMAMPYIAPALREPYHRSACRRAKKIKPEDLQSFGTKEAAKFAGYRPCKVCQP